MNKKTSVRKIEQVFGKLNTLRYFIEDPEKDFHLRGLAKISGRSPSTISSNIGLLKKLGVVSAKSSRGLTLIRANTESQLYRDAKLFYNLYIIRESGLIGFISENLRPKSLVLFGSFRKSENIPRSDIDLFAEVDEVKRIDLSKFESKLGHEVQLMQATSREIGAMRRDIHLMNNIANGIVLEGFLRVLG